MNEHYVCKGECGGTSDMAKNCEDAACSMNGQPMEKCDCTDGNHGQSAPAEA